jgi:hypothetical protein
MEFFSYFIHFSPDLDEIRYRKYLQKLSECEFCENLPCTSHILLRGVNAFLSVPSKLMACFR